LQALAPRPMSKVYARGAAHNGFDDETEDLPIKALTREEARALRLRQPLLSPWRVIGVQGVVAGVVVACAWLLTGKLEVVFSALYGAGTTMVPGALMARGMTSRLSSLSPSVSAVSVLVWSAVKTGVAIVMLLLASRLLHPVSWPALLAAMVLCMQVYWFALLWRGR
jgi:ATP synthase protein I